MRKSVTLLVLVGLTQLGGCFFFMIPGGLVQKASDGITGAEGEHCVSSTAKVGDFIGMPYGGRGEIKSLSGTSVRCTDPQRPIRARIE
jgi:hypothetical protein